jgi:hypothetical protein
VSASTVTFWGNGSATHKSEIRREKKENKKYSRNKNI